MSTFSPGGAPSDEHNPAACLCPRRPQPARSLQGPHCFQAKVCVAEKVLLLIKRRREENAVSTPGERPTSPLQKFAAELLQFLSFAMCRASLLADLRSGGKSLAWHLPTCFIMFHFSFKGFPQYFAALNHWSSTGLLRLRWAAFISINEYPLRGKV